MDPFFPLPAPQLDVGTPADLQNVVSLMGVLPISAVNPAGRLLLFDLQDVIDEFGVPGPAGISVTGVTTVLNGDFTTTVSWQRDQGAADIAFTLPDLRGTDGTNGTNGTNGVDGLSITGVTSFDNGDGTLTVSFQRDQGAADLIFVTPDLRGTDGLDGIDGTDGDDGISITGLNVTDNSDGTLTFNWQRDQAAPDIVFTTPDLTGPQGVSVTGVDVNVTASDLLEFVFALSSGSTISDSIPLVALLPMLDFKHVTDTSAFVTVTDDTFLTAVTLTETFAGGLYAIFYDGNGAIDSTGADLRTRLQLDDADLVNDLGSGGDGGGVFNPVRKEGKDSGGVSLDGSGTDQVLPAGRLGVVRLTPGSHTFTFQITPSVGGVEATEYDGLIMAMRVAP